MQLSCLAFIILHQTTVKTKRCWNSCGNPTSGYRRGSYDVMCSAHRFVLSLFSPKQIRCVIHLKTHTTATIETHQNNRLCTNHFPALHPKPSASGLGSSLVGLEGGRGIKGKSRGNPLPSTSPPLFHLIPFPCILVGEFPVQLLVWR